MIFTSRVKKCDRLIGAQKPTLMLQWFSNGTWHLAESGLETAIQMALIREAGLKRDLCDSQRAVFQQSKCVRKPDVSNIVD